VTWRVETDLIVLHLFEYRSATSAKRQVTWDGEVFMKLMMFVWAWLATASTGFSQGILPKTDHAPWDTLLKEFVNERHQVDYARLKKTGAQRLRGYILSLGRPGTQPLSPSEKKALLINAYNAFTIEWIIENYPVKSIWTTVAPFTKARHRLAGGTTSLDGIEFQLRAMGDPRIHAALVCAARSCPPLRREAYVAERLDEQLDDNAREWLADSSLNRFYPLQGKAEISPIFKWYRKDFDAYPGGLEGFLRTYAPRQDVTEFDRKGLEISFFDYDWGLNDQSDVGGNYSRLQFAIDWVRNWYLRVTDQ
jgi:hypothetical protein